MEEEGKGEGGGADLRSILESFAGTGPVLVRLLAIVDGLYRSNFQNMTPQQFDREMEKIERESGRTIGEEIDRAAEAIRAALAKNLPNPDDPQL
ncbi:MAG: hypothetical protein LBB14_00035 [Puniceicoccales bacterium]|jgi:hypothetical protein|nr:hypothetical protein [Puniceicoccales bacterium]